MDIEKRSTRFGAAVILFAVFLRLGGGLLPSPAHSLRLPEPSLEDRFPGRGPHTGLSATAPTFQEQYPTTQPTQPPLPQIPSFTPGDMDYVSLRYATDCANRADLEALLQRTLSWDLSSQEPTVLILHSHACESFTLLPGQEDAKWYNYRTENTQYNMVAVGDLLAQLLEAGGITVIHDRQLHDSPSYNAAYNNSRSSAQAYLEQYPSIQIVIDLHRDSALNGDGSQYATSAVVDGERSAQLMFVIGSHTAGMPHPNWEENLSVALKLQVLLEKRAPGITRTTILRGQRFNHDLAPGAMIVEVGTAGNTQQEAMRTMPVLAEAILALMHGAN